MWFENFDQILITPFSTTPLHGCLQNSLPDISNFLLRFKAICRKFLSLHDGDTHSRNIRLPDILVSVLYFFNSSWFCHFYSTKSKCFFYFCIFWNLLYILFWKFRACSFPISDWLKTPVLLYFEKKSHMINKRNRTLSDFLKIIHD